MKVSCDIPERNETICQNCGHKYNQHAWDEDDAFCSLCSCRDFKYPIDQERFEKILDLCATELDSPKEEPKGEPDTCAEISLDGYRLCVRHAGHDGPHSYGQCLTPKKKKTIVASVTSTSSLPPMVLCCNRCNRCNQPINALDPTATNIKHVMWCPTCQRAIDIVNDAYLGRPRPIIPVNATALTAQ